MKFFKNVKNKLCMLFLCLCILGQQVQLNYLNSRPDFNQNMQNLVRKNNNGVVLVVLPKMGSCSGAIIDARGYILTANHCAGDMSNPIFEITIPGIKQSFSATIAWQDKDKDLLLLKLKDVPPNLTVLKIAKENPVPGEILWKIGYGLGFRSINMGLMTDLIVIPEDKVGPQYIQSDTMIKPGDSGSPLMNLKGQIVGVNDRILQDNPFFFSHLGLSYSIDIETIREFLANAEAAIPVDPMHCTCK